MKAPYSERQHIIKMIDLAVGIIIGGAFNSIVNSLVNDILDHYENYRERRGLPRRTVALSLGYLWGMLILSAALTSRAWLAAVLAAVGIGVTAHILLMSKPGRK